MREHLYECGPRESTKEPTTTAKPQPAPPFHCPLCITERAGERRVWVCGEPVDVRPRFVPENTISHSGGVPLLSWARWCADICRGVAASAPTLCVCAAAQRAPRTKVTWLILPVVICLSQSEMRSRCVPQLYRNGNPFRDKRVCKISSLTIFYPLDDSNTTS